MLWLYVDDGRQQIFSVDYPAKRGDVSLPEFLDQHFCRGHGPSNAQVWGFESVSANPGAAFPASVR